MFKHCPTPWLKKKYTKVFQGYEESLKTPSFIVNSNDLKWGLRDSASGKAFALCVANLGSIPAPHESSQALIPQLRAMSKA